MNRKIIFILLPVTIVAMAMVALGPLERLLVRHYVLSNLEKALGRPAVVAQTNHHGNVLEFTNVSIQSPPGAPTVEIEQLRITYDLSWSSRRLNLTLQLVKPVIGLSREAPSTVPSFIPDLWSAWLHSDIALTVTDGQLCWRDHTDAQPLALWDGTLSLTRQSNKGAVAVVVPGRVNRSVQLSFGEGSPGISARFQSFPATLLTALARNITRSEPIFDASQGTLTGSLALVNTANGLEPRGQLAFDDLLIILSDDALQLHVKEGKLTFSALDADQGTLVQAQGDLKIASRSTEFPDSWDLEAFKGQLSVLPDGEVAVSCRGQWWHEGKVKALRFDAIGTNLVLETGTLAFVNPNGQEGHVAIGWSMDGAISAVMQGLGASEVSFIRELSHYQLGLPRAWHLTNGTFDGRVQTSSSSIVINELVARNIEVSHRPYGLIATVREARGNLVFGSENRASGKLLISDGELLFNSQEGTLGLSKNVQGQLVFHDNSLEKAALSGAFSLEKGEWKIEKNSSWHLQLHTTGQHLALVLPSKLRADTVKMLGTDEVMLSVSFKEPDQAAFCEGALAIIDRHSGSKDEALYSFELSPQGVEAIRSVWTVGGTARSWYRPFRDFLSHGSLLAQTGGGDSVYDSFTANLITHGRLKTSSLALKRYLPLLLPLGDVVEAHGEASVSGSFDSTRIALTARLSGMVLDQSSVRFEIPVKTEIVADIAHELASDHTTVRLPIHSALLIDKVHNLVCTDLTSAVDYKNGQVTFNALEGCIGGLSASGQAKISGLSNDFELDLQIKTLDGTVSQFRDVMRHLDGGSGFLHKVPLEGRVSLDTDGGFFSIRVHNGLPIYNGKVCGEVRDGALASPLADVTIRELGTRFAYVYPANTLYLSDLQGTVLAGRPGRSVEEYRLYGDRILIAGYPGGHIDFDLWIGDRVRDVIRASGEANAYTDAENHTVVDFTFDKTNTHFGNVHPDVFELSLRDWSQVTRADLDMRFDLSSILRDMQRLGRAGTPLFSQRMMEELQSLSRASGDFALFLHYDRAAPIFTFRATGSDVVLNQRHFDKVSINGNVQDDNVTIDQLRIDDFSAAADLQYFPDRWKVNFLGLRFSRALMLGLSGEYNPDEGNFKGRVDLLELNFSQLNRWDATQRFVKRYQPRGEVRAQGTIEVAVLPAPSWARIVADLDTSLRAVEIGGYRFHDAQHVVAHLDSDRALTLERLHTSLLPNRPGDPSIDIAVGQMLYHFNQGEVAINQGQFHMPKGNMGWLAETLKAPLGLIGYQLVRQFAEKISSQKEMKGQFSLQLGPSGSQANVSLDGGSYVYNRQPYVLKDLVASFNPYELSVGGQIEYRNQPVWVTLHNQCPLSRYGQLYFSNHPMSRTSMADHQPLVVGWEFDADEGFAVRTVNGKLFGIQADLRRQESTTPTQKDGSLQGDVWVQIEEFAPILPQPLTHLVQRGEIGGRYHLKGNWQAAKLLAEGLYFNGEIKANHWQVGGYRLDSIVASLDLTPQKIKITDLVIRDVAGNIEVSEATLYHDSPKTSGLDDRKFGVRALAQKESRWLLSLPQLTATDVCPSLLCRVNATSRKRRHGLSLPKFTLTGMSGDLSNFNTLVAEGNARFTHTNRKKTSKGVGGFTSDLIARIGLDADLVTPHGGTVEYQIHDGKVFLTRLKDVYSQGKLVKFTLPKEGRPSTVDFDGNLDVAIKLRPNQPLLKITDKVTLLIQGNIKKPICCVEQ